MKKYEHLPFEVILSATEGDPEAIEAVMKFYDGTFPNCACVNCMTNTVTSAWW